MTYQSGITQRIKSPCGISNKYAFALLIEGFRSEGNYRYAAGLIKLLRVPKNKIVVVTTPWKKEEWYNLTSNVYDLINDDSIYSVVPSWSKRSSNRLYIIINDANPDHEVCLLNLKLMMEVRNYSLIVYMDDAPKSLTNKYIYCNVTFQ